jgi:putative membrane protein
MMSDDEPGHEPDYRFTLANERTLLAWVRTAFGLAALGIPLAGGIQGVTLPGWHREIGLAALALSVTIAPIAYRRWRRAQEAMRLGICLPRDPLPVVLTVGVAIIFGLTLVSGIVTG